jgi:transposase-like protein
MSGRHLPTEEARRAVVRRDSLQPETRRRIARALVYARECGEVPVIKEIARQFGVYPSTVRRIRDQEKTL